MRPERPIEKMTTHDVETVKFGFDGARLFFLLGQDTVAAGKAEEKVPLLPGK